MARQIGSGSYVVDKKFQKNGYAWTNLDAALQARFSEKELWTLPDVPGWAKSHLLTSDQHLAEMKREAMAKAKPKAVNKIADAVADDIVDQIGGKINDEIADDLGMKRKPRPAQPSTQSSVVASIPAASKLQFKKLNEDAQKIVYGDKTGAFQLHKLKNGSGVEVLRAEKPGKPLFKYDEIFVTLEDAMIFANEKATNTQ